MNHLELCHKEDYISNQITLRASLKFENLTSLFIGVAQIKILFSFETQILEVKGEWHLSAPSNQLTASSYFGHKILQTFNSSEILSMQNETLLLNQGALAYNILCRTTTFSLRLAKSLSLSKKLVS